MDTLNLFTALAGAVFGCIGGTSILSGLVLRRFDRFAKKLDRREADRIREALLLQNCVADCADLAIANNSAICRMADEDVCGDELRALQSSYSELERFQRSSSAEYVHAR